jgi:spermidine/putrescine transport system permease protein
MLPGLLWLGILMVVPCAIILVTALFERGVYGGVDWSGVTFTNFARAGEWLYLSIFLDSARIAGLAVIFALLIGYPAAYAISKAASQHQTALLFLAMLPFWTNYLIRTYAWIVLLNPSGLINDFLRSIGIIDAPLPILYNEFGVILGLVYNYVPFVILAIYSALQRLDPSYAEASRDLGATAAATFWRITLPLTAPGVAAGAVFVFVLSIGNFVTPDLLGGGKLQMVGNLIYDQFLTARDWPFGSALSVILIAIMLLLLFAQAVAANRASGAGREHA